MNPAVKLSSPATREFWEIPVLFEDEQLLALDKPAGLLVSPDAPQAVVSPRARGGDSVSPPPSSGELSDSTPPAPERPCLMKLLHDGIAAGKPWARERNLSYLANAHRLDFETGGVLLLAKSKAALVALADQFGSDKPVRKYLALVRGVPPDDSFAVAEKIGPHPVKAGVMRIDFRHGKKAKTEFAVLERFSRWSLVYCVPHGERAQQIPLHLDHAGFPVVGDETHGGKKLWLSQLKRDFHLKPGREERPLISTAALHLAELNLAHPVTHETLSIKSEWPKDLRVAVKYLRLYAKGAPQD